VEDSGTPDVDALVEQLRARVDERRRDGTYPDDLEDDLAADFERVLDRRGRRFPDLSPGLSAVGAALAFDPARIPVDSERPGGDRLHRVVARLVARQIEGVFEQVGSFGAEVHRALEELARALENQSVELNGRVDAVCERQAAQERALVQASPSTAGRRPRRYSAVRLEEQLFGPREEVLARYRDALPRLSGAGPIVDLACGRGELLELLREKGMAASGADPDDELVDVASALGLPAEVGDSDEALAGAEDGSLGAVVMLRAVERLAGEAMIDLVAVAASKVRSGGVVLLEVLDPELAASLRTASRDPRHVRLYHPECLAFLFREAGFADVVVERGTAPERCRVVATR
jgi:2-polyprenyl-3-methyl-5-hydroxy-6-metoxy-1,4-benzoquinol methylase